jgi:hypothetical protein
MNIKETIGIYPGTLSDEFCDRLIEIFHEKKDLQYKGEMASGVDPTVKDTTDLNLMADPDLADIVEEICDAANEKIDLYVKRYRTDESFNTQEYLFNQGTHYPVWQLQRYEKGQGHYMAWHTEGEYHEFCSRIFAVMFYLNDVTEGGETEFIHQGLKLQPTKGTFVVWPAPWPYVHRGNVPVSNDKYILTTWLVRNDE